ncbi:DUF4019 domain-containing protein [Bosea sp. NPDC003192]|uniref:DUF4019 domain-containing protein n=1 Tax=Bosea sp. NPDC003192 TaxID=3390551 RepID=UPI003D02F500
MNQWFMPAIGIIWTVLFSFAAANAADTDANRKEAFTAAREIMVIIGDKQFEKLWDKKISDWFKSKSSGKQSFVASLTMGRANMGALKKAEIIDAGYAAQDSGYTGDIYYVNFSNEYDNAKSYERVVLIKEGQEWKVSGLFGVPQ